MGAHPLIASPLACLLLLSEPAIAMDDFERRPASGTCERAPGAGLCTCSLPTVETVLSFGEAAGLVEWYFHEFPDQIYIDLLTDLLRQCAGPGPAMPEGAPIRLRQDAKASAVPR